MKNKITVCRDWEIHDNILYVHKASAWSIPNIFRGANLKEVVINSECIPKPKSKEYSAFLDFVYGVLFPVLFLYDGKIRIV